jgi:hypothetical protein
MNPRTCAFFASACLLLSQACSSGDDDATGGAGTGGSAGQGTGGSAGHGTGGTSGSGGAHATCDTGCTLTIAAQCPHGPDTQEACVSTCEGLSTGACGAEYAAFQTCADGKPISCNADGIPAVAACSDEQAAFIACLN